MRAAPLYTYLRGCGGQSAICVGRTFAVPHAARLVAVPSLSLGSPLHRSPLALETRDSSGPVRDGHYTV